MVAGCKGHNLGDILSIFLIPPFFPDSPNIPIILDSLNIFDIPVFLPVPTTSIFPSVYIISTVIFNDGH